MDKRFLKRCAAAIVVLAMLLSILPMSFAEQTTDPDPAGSEVFSHDEKQEKNEEKPTEKPTGVPTVEPTEEPTVKPTAVPTEEPTKEPAEEITKVPTDSPTNEPVKNPDETVTDEPEDVSPTTAVETVFECGYALVKKGTLLYSDTKKTEVIGKFADDGFIYAVLEKKAAEPANDWMLVYFDHPEHEGEITIGHLLMKNMSVPTEEELEKLTVTFDKDNDTRYIDKKIAIPTAAFDFTQPEPTVEPVITTELTETNPPEVTKEPVCAEETETPVSAETTTVPETTNAPEPAAATTMPETEEQETIEPGTKEEDLPEFLEEETPTVTLARGQNGTVYLEIGKSVNFAAAEGLTAKSFKSSYVKYVTIGKTTGAATALKLGTSTITVTFTNGKTGTVKVYAFDPSILYGAGISGADEKTMALGTVAELNETKQLTAVVKPGTALTDSITWKSSNKNVATVDPNGLVTAIGPGTVTITVTIKQGKLTKTSVVKLTVTDPYKLTSATLDAGKTIPMELGATQEDTLPLQLNVALLPEGTTAKITWKSSNKKVATVDENGLVTALASGTSTITMTAVRGSVKKTQTTKITVSDPYRPTSVSSNLTGTQILYLGTELQLEPTVKPEGAVADQYIYTSSSKKIATVDKNGLVLPVKEGTVTIKITAVRGAVKKMTSVKIRVADPKKPQSVEVFPSGTITICPGEVVELKTLVTPETAEVAYTWKSAYPKYATVDKTGMVTGVKAGTTTVTVTAAFGKTKVSTKVKIKVVNKPTEYADGDYSDGVFTYTSENCRITITGYLGNKSRVVVPSKFPQGTVVAIGDSAFEGNTTIKEITLPSTIEEFGVDAFNNCINLKNIK